LCQALIRLMVKCPVMPRKKSLSLLIVFLLLGLACSRGHFSAYQPVSLWGQYSLSLLSAQEPRDAYALYPDSDLLKAEVSGIYDDIRKSLSWRPDNAQVIITVKPLLELWPDGLLIIGYPMLECLSDEAEVAGILAHMASHTIYGHVSAMLQYRYGYNHTMILPRPHEAAWDMLADQLGTVIKGGYPDRGEREADEGAIVALVMSNYDPTALSRAYTGLRKSSWEQLRKIANLHKLDPDRARRIWKRLAPFTPQPQGGWKRNQERWQAILRGEQVELTPLPPE